MASMKGMQDRIKDLMFLKHLFLGSLRACFVFGLLGPLCLNGMGKGMYVDSSGASSSPDGLSMLANVATKKLRESEQKQPVASSSAPSSSSSRPSISNPVEIDFDAFNFGPPVDTEQPAAKRRCPENRNTFGVSTSQEQQERQCKIPRSSQVERDQQEQNALLGASPELKASWETVKAQVSEETRRRSDFRTNLLVSAYRLLYEAVQKNPNWSAGQCQSFLMDKLNTQYKDELPKVNEGGRPSTQMKYLQLTFYQLLPAIAEQLPQAGLKGKKLGLCKKDGGGFEIKLFDKNFGVSNLHHSTAKAETTAEREKYKQKALEGASEQLKASWETVKASVKQEYTSRGQFQPSFLVGAYRDLYEAVRRNPNWSAGQCQSFLMDKLNTQYKEELLEFTNNGQLSSDMKLVQCTFNLLLPEMADQLPQADLGEMKLSILRKTDEDGFQCKLLPIGEQKKGRPPKRKRG